MILSSVHRFCGSAVILFALVCLAGCAVPLAPGYRVDRESITVNYVPGQPAHLAIRAEYRLVNVGTASLDAIEIGLPDEKSFGRTNLRVAMDDQQITPQQVSGEEVESAGESAVAEKWPGVWRIAFNSKWRQKERRTLVINYDLSATEAEDPRMSIGANAFYLNDSGWFPDPLEPKSLFANDITRPNPANLVVDVPDDFLVTASGWPVGSHKTANRVGRHFRLNTADFDPFIAAGAYHERRAATAGSTALLWALQPVPDTIADAVSKNIAATDDFFATMFGPLTKISRPIVILQSPTSGPPTPGPADERVPTLPGIIVFTPQMFGEGANSELAAEVWEKRLALSWFEHVITPRLEAWLLGNSLAAYAVELATEKSGAPAMRDKFIRRRLGVFNASGEQAAEKPIAFLTPADPAQQRELGDAKALLFLFALEDRCERENVERALAHMVYALRGQEYGYTDLRVALEQECHQDLSSMFATWLDQKGIPTNFRARYENNKSAN